ncbi:hypothetical protein L0668_07110 [Paraglaciecola aquimarina]|uniref:Cytochrome C Planctomycete-type domain-containing protein n=1 Tax=Paraglaciecola algarum TaxID=3050085 RepID=A0ABS9D5B5_9ALTE|nr:c-type cytochrome domain-containing protein [Paraglaciecola sp. G1-23]MCF2947869.1 hypothetical protein [Paraglaciecola sp. G1-23]
MDKHLEQNMSAQGKPAEHLSYQATSYITVKRYFFGVLILSLIWGVLFLKGKPEWLQVAAESLHLTPVLKAQTDSFYEQRIDPIFEQYCAACHNDNKQKGKLRLDSFRQLNFSGKSETNLTVAENNLLLERMSLPAEHRLAMPPYGRERHSDTDLALIKLWLDKGGSGQLTEVDFPEAPPKAKKISFEPIDWQAIEKARAPLAQEVQHLQQEYGFSLQYQARTSADLILNSFVIGNRFNDQLLTEFASVKSKLVEVNLYQSAISDLSMRFLLTCQQLKELNIAGTKISAEGLIQLVSLASLEKVLVDKTLITPSVQAKFEQASITLVGVK